MNVIIEGLDGVGKTTLAEKLMKKYDMESIIHSTGSTKNDLDYHVTLLNNNKNSIMDRFHFGEFNVFPKIYCRPCKLSYEDWCNINKCIIDNNCIFIVMICSDLTIIDERLIKRGEFNYIPEIREQEKLFEEAINLFNTTYNYSNFYVCDVAKSGAYDDLDNWIETHFDVKED